MARYHVRIHRLYGYSFVVDAANGDEAADGVWARWLDDGPDCEEITEEELVDSRIVSVVEEEAD